MKIISIKLFNYKQFKELKIDFNDDINLLIGDNDSGKSSILEAINLCLTGYYRNQNLKNNLTSEVFNKETVDEYLESLNTDTIKEPPVLKIELYTKDMDASFIGDLCSEPGCSNCGLIYEVRFDEDFREIYNEWLKNVSGTKSLPIEYYKVEWQKFSRHSVVSKLIPLKCTLVDSTNYIYQNGSEAYISRNISNNLESKDQVALSQKYREALLSFERDDIIKDINRKDEIKNSGLNSKNVSISIHDGSKNDWLSSIVVKLDNMNYPLLGKGMQSMFKIKLALSHKKINEKNLILIEELENHLSFLNLQKFTIEISNMLDDKQLIITTHNSFIINRLNLKNVLLVNNGSYVKFDKLDPDTQKYFQRLDGYDTMKMFISSKVILCEGPADELIITKAYSVKYSKLPQDDDVQIICVGSSVKRFLEISKKLPDTKVAVVLDNDKKLSSLKSNLATYLKDGYENLFTGKDDEEWTLEPCLIISFTEEYLSNLFDYNGRALNDYMRDNKTDCALKIFNQESLKIEQFPDYIVKAIEYVNK